MTLSRDELEVAVSSGQVLRISVDLRYAYVSSNLVRIVRTFGEHQEQLLRSAVIGSLKNAAPLYTFEQYVTDRRGVTAGLHAAVTAYLQQIGLDVNVPRAGFVLGLVELPRTVLNLSQQVFFQSETRLRQEFARQAARARLATAANVSRINATAAEVRGAAAAVLDRMQRVAAHRGTSQLRAEVGRMLKALAQRLGVATAAGHEALASFSLYLSVFEGGTVGISPNGTLLANTTSRRVMMLDNVTAVTPEL